MNNIVHKYKKGYRFELDIKKWWESKGYKCIRSSGSHGALDVICLKDRSVIQIQCKDMKHKISKAEKQEITKWANVTGFPVIITYKTPKIIDEFITPAPKHVRV